MILSLYNKFCLFVSTGFGVGYISKILSPVSRSLGLPRHWTGAGFFGTLLGFLLTLLLFPMSAFWTGITGLGITLLSILFSDRAGVNGEKDPSSDPDNLTAAQREAYEERAGIMEFDGGLPREAAEQSSMKGIMTSQANKDKNQDD